MYIQTEHGEGVIAYHAMNLTSYEMVQLCQMEIKVMNVLNSHHPKHQGKKIYLSDDDLMTIASILRTLTCNSVEGTSSFDMARVDIFNEQEKIFAEDKKEPLDF